MFWIVNKDNIWFSKRGKCCNCGKAHTKEIVISGEQDKYIKLCDKCFEELKQKVLNN